eukprot:753915-Hanusia_phi.AAC.11
MGVDACGSADGEQPSRRRTGRNTFCWLLSYLWDLGQRNRAVLGRQLGKPVRRSYTVRRSCFERNGRVIHEQLRVMFA